MSKQTYGLTIFCGNILNLNMQYSLGIYVMFSLKTFRQKSKWPTNMHLDHFYRKKKSKSFLAIISCVHLSTFSKLRHFLALH